MQEESLVPISPEAMLKWLKQNPKGVSLLKDQKNGKKVIKSVSIKSHWHCGWFEAARSDAQAFLSSSMMEVPII